MRVIFLLDNNEYVEVEPTKLQLRQIAAGQAALGLEVTVPLRNEDGSPKLGEDGQALLQQAFRPFVNYPVDLSIPKPEEAVAPVPVAVEVPAPAAPVAKAKKSKR